MYKRQVEEALAEEGDEPRQPPANIEAIRMVTGAPSTVRDIYEELLSRSGADELMLMCSTHDPADRIRSYELIAEAFGLESGPGDVQPDSSAAIRSA